MWIESHQSLLTHRKTGRLSRALSVGKITAIGHLHAFWWWCLDNAQDGDLTGVDVEDIADGACWESGPQEFLDGLIHAGFVDSDGAGVRVHDWHEFAGKLIEKRASDAERKRKSRASSDVRWTSDGRPTDIRVTAQVPNHTEPNLTKPTTPTTPAETETAVAEEAMSEETVKTTPLPKAIRERLDGKPPHWETALRDCLIGADIKSSPTRYLLGILQRWERGDNPPPPPPPPPRPAGSLKPAQAAIPAVVAVRSRLVSEAA